MKIIPLQIGSNVIIKKSNVPGKIIGKNDVGDWKVKYEEDGKLVTGIYTRYFLRKSREGDPNFIGSGSNGRGEPFKCIDESIAESIEVTEEWVANQRQRQRQQEQELKQKQESERLRKTRKPRSFVTEVEKSVVDRKVAENKARFESFVAQGFPRTGFFRRRPPSDDDDDNEDDDDDN